MLHRDDHTPRAGRQILLTVDDARALARESSMLAVVGPEMQRGAVSVKSAYNAAALTVHGIEPQYQAIRTIDIDRGRGFRFTDEEGARREPGEHGLGAEEFPGGGAGRVDDDEVGELGLIHDELRDGALVVGHAGELPGDQLLAAAERAFGVRVVVAPHDGRQPGDVAAGDGDRIVLVASMAGAARNPAWFHNLVADPRVEFMPRRGARKAYVARVAEGPEREQLWTAVNDLYAGYDDYQGRAGGREIPVVVLDRGAAL